jgi:hypothetical protein
VQRPLELCLITLLVASGVSGCKKARQDEVPTGAPLVEVKKVEKPAPPPLMPVKGIEEVLATSELAPRLAASLLSVAGPQGTEKLKFHDIAQAFDLRLDYLRRENGRNGQAIIGYHPLNTKPSLGEISIGPELVLGRGKPRKHKGATIGAQDLEKKVTQIWTKLGFMTPEVRIKIDAARRPAPEKPAESDDVKSSALAPKDTKGKKNPKVAKGDVKPEATQPPAAELGEVIGYKVTITQFSGDWEINNRSATMKFAANGDLLGAEIRWPQFDEQASKEKTEQAKKADLSALPEKLASALADKYERTVKEIRVVMNVSGGLVRPVMEVHGTFVRDGNESLPFTQIVDF